MLPPGTRFSKAQLSGLTAPNAIGDAGRSRHLDPRQVRHRSVAVRPAGRRSGPSGFAGKGRPILDIVRRVAIERRPSFARYWNQSDRPQLNQRFRWHRRSGSGLLEERAMTILKWALIFFLVSIVAGVLGFTDISAASADVARFLFYVFVVIFLVLLILGLTIFRV
jgi:uncharacterized membrane protein YtjA (UPF0391 family)